MYSGFWPLTATCFTRRQNTLHALKDITWCSVFKQKITLHTVTGRQVHNQWQLQLATVATLKQCHSLYKTVAKPYVCSALSTFLYSISLSLHSKGYLQLSSVCKVSHGQFSVSLSELRLRLMHFLDKLMASSPEGCQVQKLSHKVKIVVQYLIFRRPAVNWNKEDLS